VFEPYYYGPLSFAIYPDLDLLVRDGLLRTEVEGAKRSPNYSLTPSGTERANVLGRSVPRERLALIGQLRDWVAERSFRQLLTDIYRLYPDYAVRSIFR
jgi:DNA-binding PadR family transcriptional regulator